VCIIVADHFIAAGVMGIVIGACIIAMATMATMAAVITERWSARTGQLDVRGAARDHALASARRLGNLRRARYADHAQIDEDEQTRGE
jgi:hypothetical protein